MWMGPPVPSVSPDTSKPGSPPPPPPPLLKFPRTCARSGGVRGGTCFAPRRGASAGHREAGGNEALRAVREKSAAATTTTTAATTARPCSHGSRGLAQAHGGLFRVGPCEGDQGVEHQLRVRGLTIARFPFRRRNIDRAVTRPGSIVAQETLDRYQGVLAPVVAKGGHVIVRAELECSRACVSPDLPLPYTGLN